MSTQARPMTHRQALAVCRRLRKARPDSTFDITGRDDTRFIQEIRPTKNPHSGIEFDTIVMHGRELPRTQRKAVRKPRVLRRAS